MADTTSPDCPCVEPVFSTTHVVLGGLSLASLLGLVGYAAWHNHRHHLEFDFLYERQTDTNQVLRNLLPGFSTRLAVMHGITHATRDPEENEAIERDVLDPFTERLDRRPWKRGDIDPDTGRPYV